jgi:hypothetical protein
MFFSQQLILYLHFLLEGEVAVNRESKILQVEPHVYDNQTVGKKVCL